MAFYRQMGTTIEMGRNRTQKRRMYLVLVQLIIKNGRVCDETTNRLRRLALLNDVGLATHPLQSREIPDEC